MGTTKVVRFVVGALAFLLVGGPRAAVAQPAPFSHIHCAKVKDRIPRATYKADEFFFTTGTVGCVIKVPAKLMCAATPKTNVNPPPPGGGPATGLPPSTTFFCYKQKCPRFTASFTAKDQFGTHTINQPVRSTLLCAPAE